MMPTAEPADHVNLTEQWFKRRYPVQSNDMDTDLTPYWADEVQQGLQSELKRLGDSFTERANVNGRSVF